MTFSFHGKFRTWNLWQRFFDFGNGAGIYNIVFSQMGNNPNLFIDLYDAPGSGQYANYHCLNPSDCKYIL